MDAFPDVEPSWIVHEDDEFLVVDKPPGVSSQAADADVPDDIVARLRQWLTRQGKPSYLGVHQRLDEDTSGVLVFVRKKELNAHVAQQFERRRVKKTYLACVTGWPKNRNEATLRDLLRVGDDGRAQRGPGGKPAVTHVRVKERRGERTLLQLELETGRTHQARAQLYLHGAPIAGDVLYGSVPAPRLMLHAAELSMDAPRGGRPLTFRAPPPKELLDFLEKGERGARVYDERAPLDAALRLAARRRYGLARALPEARRTTAFRLVNEAGDGLPGLAVDVYGAHLVAQFYDDADGLWSDARRDRVLDALGALGFEGVYQKVRPKQANTLVDTRRDDLAPKLPVRGSAAPDELEIFEEGIPYLVRLGDGLSTGIFLDQRANRRRLRHAAKGKLVLNLFSYTCGFSVAAAVGGATKTVSVDASAAALERGRAGLTHVGLDPRAHQFVADDAFSWLKRALKKPERYDLAILDPPSYSSTKRGRFVAETDYAELAAETMRVLGPGAELLACTNHRGIRTAKFRRVLFDAARLAQREVAQVKDLPPPSDYPAPVGAESHLKAVWVKLR